MRTCSLGAVSGGNANLLVPYRRGEMLVLFRQTGLWYQLSFLMVLYMGVGPTLVRSGPSQGNRDITALMFTQRDGKRKSVIPKRNARVLSTDTRTRHQKHVWTKGLSIYWLACLGATIRPTEQTWSRTERCSKVLGTEQVRCTGGHNVAWILLSIKAKNISIKRIQFAYVIFFKML